MAQVAPKLLTFEEFAALNSEGRYELVNGRLEELVAPRPRHGWTGGRFFSALDGYLSEHERDAYWSVELDIPTLPFHGRRPDVAYYSAADAARYVDLQTDTVTGVPTLVIEVVSPDDQARDLVDKRSEYAEVGIAHYWIAEPASRTVTCLRLQDEQYVGAGYFREGEVLTSELFPGLRVPLSSLFR